MIGAIPNPKKSITVDFPLAPINQAATFITNIDNRYALQKINKVFNQFTYEAGEFLSFGVFIDINLSSLSDTKTQITIEIRRKLGAFDKPHEVTYANQHIENIITSISTWLQLTDSQKAAIFEKYKGKEGSTKPEKGKTKFNCGICKKSFYADRTLNNIAICPHCKGRNTLPQVAKGCGTFIAMIFIAATTLLFFFFLK